MKLPKSSGKPRKRKLLIVRRVVGKSMLPTLRPESIVVATGAFWAIKPDRIVVVRHDGLDKIKRIQKVSGARVFVVGDNTRQSLDSRSFGWLPMSAVVAKVVWPRA